MASLTKIIEEHITQLFQETEEEVVALRRKDLAELFGCVPSQINYVLRSRFTPERGFLVDSQRGGHGYIRILRLSFRFPEDRVNHIEDLVGETLSEPEAKRLLLNLQHRKIITGRERLLVEVALRYQEEVARSLFDLSPYRRDVMNAELLKRMLRSLVLS